MAPIVAWLAPAVRSLGHGGTLLSSDEVFQRQAVIEHTRRTAGALTRALGTEVLAGVSQLHDGRVAFHE